MVTKSWLTLKLIRPYMSYEQVKFVHIRNSDCAYKFIYKAANTFD